MSILFPLSQTCDELSYCLELPSHCDISQQLTSFQLSMDNLNMHIEESDVILNMIQFHYHQVPNLLSFIESSQHLSHLYSQIDKILLYINSLEKCLEQYEEYCSFLENQNSQSTGFTALFRNVLNLNSYKKCNINISLELTKIKEISSSIFQSEPNL